MSLRKVNLLIRKEIALYKKILVLSQHQLKLIKTGKYDKIDNTIDAKNQIIEEIKAIDVYLAEYLNILRDNNDNNLGDNISARLSDLYNIIKDIERLEASARGLLTREKDGVEAELKKLIKHKTIVNNYQPINISPPRIIDTRH